MNSSFQYSYEVLGPIFRYFLFRLRLIEESKREVPFLFLSRGGIRLRYFYDLYLESNRLASLAPRGDFYVSRKAAFRALLATQPEIATEVISKEHQGLSVRKALEFFLPKNVYQDICNEGFEEQPISNQDFSSELLLELLNGQNNLGEILRQHANKQYEYLTGNFNKLTDYQDEVVLVDTGWSGSIVRSLSLLFPDTDMTAAFFGRYSYGKATPSWFPMMTGLILQNEFYSPLKPQSAIIFHRHLIESLCEPGWPSVSYYERTQDGILPSTGLIPESIVAPSESESLAFGVSSFIKSNQTNSPHEAHEEYKIAIRRLAKTLTYPSREQTNLLVLPPRSIDFGRDGSVKVLLGKSPQTTKIQRVREALWHQGQASMEFRILRIPAQFALTWWKFPKRIAHFAKRIFRR